MTVHTYSQWYSNFECPDCKAYYIPFDESICCPRCGKKENKNCDFIERIVSAMELNKMENGTYAPSGYYIGCYSDHIVYLVCNFFELFRKSKDEDEDEDKNKSKDEDEDKSKEKKKDKVKVKKNEKEFEKFLDEWLEKVKFGDQDYGRKFVREVVLEVERERNS